MGAGGHEDVAQGVVGHGEEDGRRLTHGLRGAGDEAIGDGGALRPAGDVEVGVPGDHLGEAPGLLQGQGE
jgi:hypothetical protein